MGHKVFISSTRSDLSECREHARSVVLALGHHPLMMEDFPPMTPPPASASLQKIDEANVFVLIIAHRYGSIAAGDRRSITECEFDHAHRKGMPLWCFLLEDSAPWPHDEVHRENQEALSAFKLKVKDSTTVRWFRTPGDFRLKLSEVLSTEPLTPMPNLRGIGDLTPRELVNGFLLSLLELQHRHNQYPASILLKETHELAAVFELVLRVLPAAGSALYGFPSWLKGDSSEGPGYYALLAAISSPDPDSAWKPFVRVAGSNDRGADPFDLLTVLESARPSPARDFELLRERATLSAIGGELVESTLAARGIRSFSALQEISEVARRSDDPLRRELGVRLLRVDLPLVTARSGEGILVGADLRLKDAPGTDTPVSISGRGADEIRRELPVLSRDWAISDPEFEKGIARGLAAVETLAERVGALGETERHITLEVRGVLPPIMLTDSSAGLPVALHVLARLADLPPPRVAATGSFDDTLHIQPAKGKDLAAKLEALKVDGLLDGLLAYIEPAEDEEDLPGLVRISEPTLEAAAQATWGLAWTSWMQKLQGEVFSAAGLRHGWPEGRFPGALLGEDDEPIIVEPPQARALSEYFESNQPAVAFLGGRQHTGKTWIAQLVEKRLLRLGWSVFVFTPRTDTIPAEAEITKAVRALTAKGAKGNLLILDDVEWLQGAESLEEEMWAAAASCQINILIVIRSDDLSDWITDRSLALTPITESGFDDFAKNLIEVGKLQGASRFIGQIKARSGGDLWWLVHSIGETAKQGGKSKKHEDLLTRFYHQALQGASVAERESIRRVAALSWVGVSVPHWFLLGDYDRIMKQIRARKNHEGWFLLPSRAACESILLAGERSPGSRMLRATLKAKALPTVIAFIKEAAGRADEFTVAYTLSKLSRTSDDILAAVTNASSESLAALIEKSESSTFVVRLLRLVGPDVPELRPKWASRCADLVRVRLPALTGREFVDSLDVLRLNRNTLRNEEELPDQWERLLESLDQQTLRGILQRTPMSRSRLAVIRALWRLHEEATDSMLADLAPLVTEAERRDDGTFPAEDYWTVIETWHLLEKLRFDAARGLEGDERVEALAQAELADDEGISGFIARLCVRDLTGLERIDEAQQERAEAAEKRFHRSRLGEAATAFGRLRKYNRFAAVKLLTDCRAGSHLLSAVSRAPAAEIARFLNVMLHLHTQTARDVLYRRTDQPRGDHYQVHDVTLETLARALSRSGDGKGLGLLLRETSEIDANYGSIKKGFANALAERLGEDFFVKLIEREPRVSVVYYLLEGLVRSEARFADAVLGHAVETIVRTIQVSFRAWAPRLALLLLEHPALGRRFGEELAKRIHAARLLNGMLNASWVESLGLFHRLALALHSETAARFAKEVQKIETRFLSRLYQVDQPEVLVRVARSIAQTLSEGGNADWISRVLEAVGGQWSERLRHAGRAGDLAEAVWGLEALVPEEASDLVAKMGEFWKSRLLSAHTEPATAVDLLDAIDNARPGAAVALIREVERTGFWRAFRFELCYEQNPRLQGDCYRRLAKLGYLPPTSDRRMVYEGKWKQAISSVSSPAALYSLLQTFANWELSWGQEAARLIDLRRVVTRLEHGAREDLAAAGGLIGTLDALGADSYARQLFEAFRGHVPSLCERLGLEDSLKLVLTAWERDEDLARTLVRDCVALAQEVASSHYVVDAGKHALAIGWSAYYGKKLGRELVCEAEPPALRRVHDPRLRLWAVGWMAERPWVGESRAAATAQIEEPPRKPWSAAGVLAVCASVGLLEELAPEADSWRHALDAAPLHLIPLLDAAVDSAGLRDLLSDGLEHLKMSFQSGALRVHPGRAPVLRLLERIS